LPVQAFDLKLLPDTLRPRVADISDRLQCSPDHIGITTTIALGSITLVAGSAILPQLKTDWIEVPNFWGGSIGPARISPSPPRRLGEALHCVWPHLPPGGEQASMPSCIAGDFHRTELRKSAEKSKV
jgi:hypothetical protein